MFVRLIALCSAFFFLTPVPLAFGAQETPKLLMPPAQAAIAKARMDIQEVLGEEIGIAKIAAAVITGLGVALSTGIASRRWQLRSSGRRPIRRLTLLFHAAIASA